jgi:hypothetical protein
MERLVLTTLIVRRLSNLSPQLLAALQSAARPVLFFAVLAMAAPAFGQQSTITGTVVDTSGAFIAHARVTLALDGRGPDQETSSADGGDFSFSNVAPGQFRVGLTAEGFTAKIVIGELHAGESLRLPETVLTVATFIAQVNVTPGQADIAEAQIKVEEKQRLVGLVPNYFVNYDPDAAPLNAEQKFELTRRAFLDPSAFVITAVIAGVGQAQNTHKGFGRGAQGYAKRYGAAYGDFVTGRLIEKVIMPTIFKQDPRYFYKGTGTTRSRFFYAISRSVMCRGDNKHVQFCYSSVISRFAAAALTNLYYPAADRNSTGVSFENAAIGVGGSAVGNLFQEFIARRLTRKTP